MKSIYKLISRCWGSNGVANRPAPEELKPPPPQSNLRYALAISRVSTSPLYRPYTDAKHPYGFYHNRHIIGESTRVLGGIYISATPAEAIVIDERYEMLRPLIAAFRSRVTMTFQSSVTAELALLEEVFNLADSAFKWDPEGVKEFNAAHGIGTDSKVALDSYIKERIGVCRHKVLLAAYLIEKLKEEGRLTGNKTIPAQLRFPEGNDEVLIYTFSDGSFATFDPHPDVVDADASPEAINS